MLTNRQIADTDSFFRPQLPTDITATQVGLDQKALTKAATLLTTAIAKQQKVVIFGDYDVDGICATAILWEALFAKGLAATPFIPHRMKHGYGLSIGALEEIFLAVKPDLIVTVDNGIVAHPALAWLAEQQVPVILTDHHQPDSTKPQATVIVHTPQICGSAVSWFLAREISMTATERQIDLLGLATLADQMPLVGVNRSFAYHGLTALKTTERPGLIALKQVAKLTDPLTNQAVQFGLIPRLNAMGRLEHGLTSLRLLCVKSPARAKLLADELDQTNQNRQQLTTDLFKEALDQANTQTEESLIVVSSPLFHEGVIGLIAGRLMETLAKPVIALHVGEKTSKASIRSVPGINIIEFLRAQPVKFLELGGHALAAGFVINSSDIPDVRTALQNTAREQMKTESLIPMVRLECELPLSLITVGLYKKLEECQPFGQANPVPLFGTEELQLLEVRRLGKEEQHLKIIAQDKTNQQLTIMFWRQGSLAAELVIGQKVQVAGRVELNEWRGKSSIQFIATDLLFLA